MLKIIRALYLVLHLIFGSIVNFFICLMRPFNPQNSRLCGKVYGYAMGPLGVDVKVLNEHHLEDHRPCVYIANHQGSLDLFLLGGNIPNRTVAIGKKEIKFIPFFGLVFWLAGNIFIDRSNKKRALKSMEDAKRKVLDHDISIWVMPEGTRSRGRGLLPFKKGAFYLAQFVGIPIVPIVISEYYTSVNLNKVSSGDITISVLPPVSTKNVSSDQVNDLKDQCYNLMKQEYERISAK